MPSSVVLDIVYRQLQDLDRKRNEAYRKRHKEDATSPATLALRNLLGPSSPQKSETHKRLASPSPTEDRDRQQRSRFEHDYISLECSGACRRITGQMRSIPRMTDSIVELVYFLQKVINTKHGRTKRNILVHCQDGYTESSILVLAYIMATLSISLPEAYLHLQNKAQRSFFLYTTDKPLLKHIDARLAADRKSASERNKKNSAPLVATAKSSPSRWKSWGMGLGHTRSPSDGEERSVDTSPKSQDSVQSFTWFEDPRFDGFPSRILPFLYLGNL